MTERRPRGRRIARFAAHGTISFLIEVLLLVLFAALAVGLATLGLWIS